MNTPNDLSQDLDAIARFADQVEREMLAHGLSPDDERDQNLYLRAKLLELRFREH